MAWQQNVSDPLAGGMLQGLSTFGATSEAIVVKSPCRKGELSVLLTRHPLKRATHIAE